MAWNAPGDNQQDPWNKEPKRDRAKGKSQDPLQILRDIGEDFFGGNSQGGMRFISSLVATTAFLWFALGLYQLDEQERAVVLHFGIYQKTEGPGLHWYAPMIDRVYRENVTQIRSNLTRGHMLTEDENIVDVDITVQYTIGDIRNYVLNLRDPVNSMQEASESALRHVVGGTKMDEVLTLGREKISVDVQARLQAYLDSYGAGIVVTQVNVQDIKAPEAVKAAFDDVSKAREDEERVKNEAETYANTVVPEARGKSSRILEEASAYRDQLVSRAQGEASRFTQLYEEYRKAPKITRERLYIEAVQEVLSNSSKVLVDVKAGNNMLYLPIDRLGKSATQPEVLPPLPPRDTAAKEPARPAIPANAVSRQEVR
jgi:modulator of FtsH protease HflK